MSCSIYFEIGFIFVSYRINALAMKQRAYAQLSPHEKRDATMILGVAVIAHAAPPVAQPIDTEMSRWYQSLKQPGPALVPNGVVLHREHRAGSAVACLQTQWNYGFGPPPADFSPDILCFIPGPDA
jgi:hypothetical protein